MPTKRGATKSKNSSSSLADSKKLKLKSKETYEFTWLADITPFYAKQTEQSKSEFEPADSLCKLSSSKFLAGLSAGSLSEWHLSLVLDRQSQNLDAILCLDRIINNSTNSTLKSSKSPSTSPSIEKVKVNFGLQFKLINFRGKPLRNVEFPELTLGPSTEENPDENQFNLGSFITWKSLIYPQNKLVKISKDKSQKHIKIKIILDFYGLVSCKSPEDLEQAFVDQIIQDFGDNTWEANFLKEELEKPADIFIKSSEGKLFPAHSSIIKVRAPLFALELEEAMKRNRDESHENDPDEISQKRKLPTMDVDMDDKTINSFLQVVYRGGGQENSQEDKFKRKDDRKSSPLNAVGGPCGLNLTKIACLNEMVRRISVQNAALILHIYRCGHTFEPNFMCLIGNYCFDNSEEIKRSQGFKDHFGDDTEAFSSLYISLLTEDQFHQKMDEKLRGLKLT